MRKILLALFLATALSIFQPSSIQADFDQAYQDYSYQYRLYKEAYTRFTVAKSTYVTYKTLTAQAEVIKRFQELLHQRSQVVTSYLDLLQEKLNVTAEIEPIDTDAFFTIRKDMKKWLDEYQIKINNVATVNDANSVAAQFDGFYKQASKRINQVIGRVIFTHTITLNKKMVNLISRTEQVVRLVNQSGEDATLLQRGMIQLAAKKSLYDAKYQQAKVFLSPDEAYLTGRDVNILSGQQILLEANQYLHEATNLLLEVIKNITG